MWPFTRKPKPINPGPINEDWRVGDLAEYIGTGAWIDGDTGAAMPGPERGDVLKVSAVRPETTVRFGDSWFLSFSGFPNLYRASRFRKVPPLNSEADAEFTAKIKAIKPKKVRA